MNSSQFRPALTSVFLVLLMGLSACSAPPLLEQAPATVPLVDEKGDLIFEGSVGANPDNAVLQGHVTWAFSERTAFRAGLIQHDDVMVRDETAGNANDSDAPFRTRRRQGEVDIALGRFWASADGRRVIELYGGVANGKAGGGYDGVACSLRCDGSMYSSRWRIVYGSYYRSYVDLNAGWKLGSQGRFLLGASGRLAHYDPYDMRDVNRTEIPATTRTMLEPSIFTGFRVGGFQIIGQYANAVQLGGYSGNYEYNKGVASIRLQWRYAN